MHPIPTASVQWRLSEASCRLLRFFILVLSGQHGSGVERSSFPQGELNAILGNPDSTETLIRYMLKVM